MIVVLRSEEMKRKVIENVTALIGTDYEEVGIVPDLTQMQREEEDSMRKEADRRNREDLSQEDRSKNLVWSVVGARGEKRIIKTADRGRGGWRGPSRGRGGHPRRGGQARGGRNPNLNNGENRTGNKRTRDRAAEEGMEEEMAENPAKR